MDDMSKIYKTDFGYALNYNIGDKLYLVELIYPQEQSNYHIPYILVTPSDMKEKTTIAVEVNNLESSNQEKLLENGLSTAYRLTKNLIEFNKSRINSNTTQCKKWDTLLSTTIKRMLFSFTRKSIL